MAAIELTKPAFEALEREAHAQMDAAIGDLGMGGADTPERAKLLACADVLSAVQKAKIGWGLRDPREEDATRVVEFSPGALAFIEEQRRATEGHVEELDRTGEGDLAYNAGEVFLLHVLNRILGTHAEREAVAA